MNAKTLDRLSQLPDEQRSLIYRSLLDSGHPFAALPVPVRTKTRTAEIPLLATQRRIVNLETREPGSRFNRVELALVLDGPLNPSALAAAIDDVSARHEGLRCVLDGDDPSSIRIAASGASLETVDLSYCSDIGQALEELRTKVAATVFLSGAAPLWRVALARLEQHRHVLIFEFHHVVIDGYALNIVALDTAFAYRARMNGAKPDWPAPAPQFSDYAIFENDVYRCGLRSLGRMLSEPTSIPADTSPIANGLRIARSATRLLSPNDCTSIADKCRESGVTLATGLTAIATAAIAYLSGTYSVECGIAVSGRDHPASVGLVAPLVYNAAFSAEVVPEATVPLLFKNVDLALKASLAEGPLRAASPVPCLIIVQNANVNLPDLPGIEVSRLAPRVPGSHHELVVCFVPEGDTWRLELEVNGSMFTEARAEAVADFIHKIAIAIGRAGACALRDCLSPDWSTASEWLTSERNASLASMEDASPLQVLLARKAAEDPEHPAILMPDGSVLSYKTLFDAAKALATEMSVAEDAGRPVALALPHGPELVVAMLASVLACRPFVVLDDLQGGMHATAVLDKSAATLLLTDKSNTYGNETAIRRLLMRPINQLSEDGGVLEASQKLKPSGDAAIYIALTSGSSGKPKGIVQSERSFRQFLSWQETHFGYNKMSRIAMWSSPVFDACYTEVFGALRAGGTLCIIEPALRTDPKAVARWLDCAAITSFLTIPSFLSFVMEEAADAGLKLSCLRDVSTSGEVLNQDAAKRLSHVAPYARLTNLFGPTECVLASCHTVPADHAVNNRVPVGRPLDGRNIVLVDERRFPVPLGAVGEIAVISDYLAVGYLGEDVHNRFATNSAGQRVFFTGDRGRINEEGLLCFEGRADAQIKIRGMLVDLDGIARVIEEIPGARACHVIALKVGTSHNLIAAVTPALHQTSKFDPHLSGADFVATCRDRVRNVFGDRALPTECFFLQSFPRTPTGKIDRSALAMIARDLLAEAGNTADAAARSPQRMLEGEISNVWGQLLGRRLPTDVRFFEAGGDSLMAVQLHRMLEEAFPGRFQLLDVFANPTISMLAAKGSGKRDETDVIQSAIRRANKRHQHYKGNR